jgi:hypothetical protein
VEVFVVRDFSPAYCFVERAFILASLCHTGEGRYPEKGRT